MRFSCTAKTKYAQTGRTPTALQDLQYIKSSSSPDLKLLKRIHTDLRRGMPSVQAEHLSCSLRQRPDAPNIGKSVQQAVYKETAMELFTFKQSFHNGSAIYTKGKRVANQYIKTKISKQCSVLQQCSGDSVPSSNQLTACNVAITVVVWCDDVHNCAGQAFELLLWPVSSCPHTIKPTRFHHSLEQCSADTVQSSIWLAVCNAIDIGAFANCTDTCKFAKKATLGAAHSWSKLETQCAKQHESSGLHCCCVCNWLHLTHQPTPLRESDPR